MSKWLLAGVVFRTVFEGVFMIFVKVIPDVTEVDDSKSGDEFNELFLLFGDDIEAFVVLVCVGTRCFIFAISEANSGSFTDFFAN